MCEWEGGRWAPCGGRPADASHPRLGYHINQPQDGDKCGFILERLYQGSGEGTYSVTRIYEGHIKVTNKSILGEGKIEMEKYSDLITVGFFSIVSIDDERDDIDKLGGGHAVLEGVDQ